MLLNLLQKHYIYIAWATALASVVGSLYFSEIAHYLPCVLCWWQRVLMYPMVVILGVGILRKDRWVPYYVLPFSVAGMGIALFHELLQAGIIPETLSACFTGVSCTAKYIDYLGFITIPFLSLVAFGVITFCMVALIRSLRNK